MVSDFGTFVMNTVRDWLASWLTVVVCPHLKRLYLKMTSFARLLLLWLLLWLFVKLFTVYCLVLFYLLVSAHCMYCKSRLIVSPASPATLSSLVGLALVRVSCVRTFPINQAQYLLMFSWFWFWFIFIWLLSLSCTQFACAVRAWPEVTVKSAYSHKWSSRTQTYGRARA